MEDRVDQNALYNKMPISQLSVNFTEPNIPGTPVVCITNIEVFPRKKLPITAAKIQKTKEIIIKKSLTSFLK